MRDTKCGVSKGRSRNKKQLVAPTEVEWASALRIAMQSGTGEGVSVSDLSKVLSGGATTVRRKMKELMDAGEIVLVPGGRIDMAMSGRPVRVPIYRLSSKAKKKLKK